MAPDGGYKSRKLTMAYVCLALMTMGFFATARWPALVAVYMEYNMAVLAAASIYTGGNTITKWIQAKKTVKSVKGPKGAVPTANTPSKSVLSVDTHQVPD